MVERDDSVGSGRVEIVDTLDLHPEQRAVENGERIAQRARGHGAADRDRHHEARSAEQDEQLRRRHAHRLQHGHDHRAAGHERGIEHVDRGHHARATIGAGPGLHRRKGRHDEEPAGRCQAGEIQRQVQPASAGKDREIAVEAADRRGAERGEAEVDCGQAEQDGADDGGQENDPARC